MKRHLVVTLLMIFTFLLNYYNTMAQKKQSVLWEISGNGLKQKSYLLGTIHIVPYHLLTKFTRLEKIIKSTDIGVFEITSTSNKNYDPILEAKAFPPLDSVFSKEDYQLVDSFFIANQYGSIRDHNNDASLPAMLQAILMIKNQSSEKNPSKVFLEDSIKSIFSENKKKLIQLDEPNTRAANIIEHGNIKNLANLIVDMIKAPLINLEGMIDEKLYTSTLTYPLNLSSPIPDNSSLMNKQATKRNLQWIPTIETAIKEGSCFIGVGLFHIQYNTGVIQLLKNKGYCLKPIKLKHRVK